MAMSETPEVPDDEATESKTDIKERMRSFGEKAKAFGEKTGKRSKELGKKVAEATKETTAKVAEATKETTAKATEAGKKVCLLYTSPSPRDRTRSRMPSSA